MTGFLSIGNYSAFLVLAAGLATSAAFFGIGNVIGRRMRLPQPWAGVVGSIAAIEAFALLLTIISIAHIAYAVVLIVAWAVLVVAGGVALIANLRREKPRIHVDAGTASIVVFLLLQLMIAICPSTKGDELYYHMIVPARIVLDHGLRFYRSPFISAIYPQMLFEIAFAPFHAMRIPDAGNVVSWFFGALLIGFVYALVARVTSSRVWAAFCAAAVLTGMYTPVWHVASNAYAIGDLGVTAAVIALYLLPDLVAQAGRSNVMLSFSILSIAAASSKISLFPIAGVLTLLAFVRMLRENRGDAARLLAAAVLPPLLVMGPLLVWTFIASGSPFGPLLAGRFGPSIYDVARIRGFLDNYVGGSRGPIPEKLRNAIVEDSPLIWIGIAAFMFWKRVRVERAIGIALLALQVLLIAGWMTLDVRYLAGVHYALAILAAIFLSADIREKLLRPRTLVLLTAVFIVPWFALQAVYATPFVRFLASGESLSHFCAERVGFFDDYLSLDRRVGGDAVLFAYPFAMSSFYAPRPILYDPDDLPAGRPVYLLTFNAMFESDPQPSVPRGFRAGPMIYENRNAVVAAFREPGREPRRGVVRAWRLDRAKGQS